MVFALAIGPGCAGSLRAPPRTDDPGIASLISLRLSSDARLCAYEIAALVTDRTARLDKVFAKAGAGCMTS
jgi:hypothetical protein